ncbi:helix-turn-helix domain-containing protein [Actinomadura madurae]|uniref:PucR family transcriptional regulator n=1 Tax=Actinomadura madurae TaxID=1993 RepID=UPI002025DAC0|nr:helix-turn-helix domain-containing protein [Actinomadura madurae]URM99970.1 helix-turn-helix domain-containing protein [Actinomadura madurae]
MRAREATMEALVGALAPEESLVEQIIARVRAEIPSYTPVPHESLIASVERNLGLAARTISSGRAPTAEEISEAEVSTLERLQQGVPIEDIMRGFRVVLSRIQARLVAVAPFHGVEPADVVELSSLLWQLGDAFSARVAVVYRQHDIAAAVADQQRRTEWVMRVLTLGLPSTELHQGAVAYGLPRESRLYALRAVPLDTASPLVLRREIERFAAPPGTGGLVIQSGDEVVGLLARVPSGIRRGVVAVGPARPLSEARESFDIATRVLAAARRPHRAGVHSLETVTWRLGVAQCPEVTEVLRDRYLAPLRGHGEFGRVVVEALDGYLLHRRNIPAAAAALHVHHNTLRYRLRRFEEIASCSLEESDTLVELSWLLAGLRPDDLDSL